MSCCPRCSAACILCTLETATDMRLVHVVQLLELSMEKHKLNLEKVQLENQLEAEQEYIVHKLQKQVGSMYSLAAPQHLTVVNMAWSPAHERSQHVCLWAPLVLEALWTVLCSRSCWPLTEEQPC